MAEIEHVNTRMVQIAELRGTDSGGRSSRETEKTAMSDEL